MQQHLRFMRIRAKLIETAKTGQLITYGEFVNNSSYKVVRGQGQPWQIGTVLGDICTFEHNQGRPLLSAICVLKKRGKPDMPSSGFWELDFLPDSVKKGTYEQQRRFWECKRDEVFDYWQKHKL